MSLEEFYDSLVKPKDSGCTSHQSYEHCDPGKYESPDCRNHGKPDNCWIKWIIDFSNSSREKCWLRHYA